MKKILLLVILLIVLPLFCWANTTINFVWNANQEEDLDGYHLYQSNKSGVYDIDKNKAVAVIPAGTEYCTLNDVPDGTWFWVLTAFDKVGNESGKSNEVTLTIDTTIPDTEPPAPPTMLRVPIAEIGLLNLDHTLKRVIFTKTFLHPVVVANTLSCNEVEPAVIRIANVTMDGFDIWVQEWGYLDGNHAMETSGYVVMEQGFHVLPEGVMMEAGICTAGVVKFSMPFNEVPVVIASICSNKDKTAVTHRIKNISTVGFEIMMQEQELNDQQHVDEVISFIAWEPSIGKIGHLSFEVVQTKDVFFSEWCTLTYNKNFTKPPILFADMQTTNGSDPTNLRWQRKTAANVEIKLMEEQSKDVEMHHIKETIGYIAIEKVINNGK